MSSCRLHVACPTEPTSRVKSRALRDLADVRDVDDNLIDVLVNLVLDLDLSDAPARYGLQSSTQFLNCDMGRRCREEGRNNEKEEVGNRERRMEDT